MVRGVIKDYNTAIRQKEHELLAHEEAYFQEKQQLEARAIDLNDRRHRLANALEGEQEKMRILLHRYKAPHEEAIDFYRDIQELQEESERLYRLALQELEDEKADLKHRFYREHDQIEIQLQELRRKNNGHSNDLLQPRQ